MAPARRRRAVALRNIGPAIVFYSAAALLNRQTRTILFVGAIGFLLAAGPLRWMGKIPEDMPSARDPEVRLHPQYKQVARRGRIAGIAIGLAELVMAVVAFNLQDH
ncbi:hypothetical protein ACIQF6_06795 [Kitasatospora sp. NPDC092948]|uniref:hypothetical protein n=1 Tax=Kitasatospora sp. NPDC092948 TaxID=3364088 RepID=UPI00380DA72A